MKTFINTIRSFKKLIKKIKLIRTSLDINTLEVVKKSSSSLLVKMIGLIAGFVISIFLGRTIGPEGLGIINLSSRIIDLILVFTLFGMDNVVRKETAIAFERKDWPHIRNVIFTSLRINLPIAFGLSLGLIFLSPWLAETVFNEPKIKIPLIIFSALLIPQMLSRIFAAGINGFRKVWQSNLVNDTLSSAVVAVGLILMFFTNIEINLLNVALLYGVGRLFVTIAVGSYWHHLFRYEGKRFMLSGPMLKVALPLLLVTSTNLIAANSDVFMLGLLSDLNQVGLYSVASRLGLLSNFFFYCYCFYVNAKNSQFVCRQEISGIRKNDTTSNQRIIFIGLATVMIYFFFGEFILNFWGKQIFNILLDFDHYYFRTIFQYQHRMYRNIINDDRA